MKKSFTITLTTTQKLTGCIPRNDDTAREAVRAFGHILNTPERRNRAYGAREFAEMIARHADMGESRTAAIVAHLRELDSPPVITPSVSSIDKSVLA